MCDNISTVKRSPLSLYTQIHLSNIPILDALFDKITRANARSVSIRIGRI